MSEALVETSKATPRHVSVARSAGTRLKRADEAELHLLKRATFGPTPASLAALKRQGRSAWLDAQLNPASVPDVLMSSLRSRWPRLAWTSQQVRERMSPHPSEVMLDLLAAHTARAIWSERQLYEVVVDFWTNHLVVPAPSSDVWTTAHRYSYDVIRRHALGRYADLLWASATHPAMLTMLDNALSTKQAPNENYGREVLELHTVGIGRYGERDVRNSALTLTGLTIDPETERYRYDPAIHYVGPVTVMGWSHSNASAHGESVARAYLTYLARHRYTAERLARKLAVRFVSDNPPASLISTLAAVYLKHDTAIVPVLKALFTSAEFAAAVGQKIKTPYEDAIATLRILGVKPEKKGDAATRAMHWYLDRLGQAPMNWPAPNGYPDVAAAWTGVGTTLARWNLHHGLAAGWWVTELQHPDLRTFLPRTAPATYGAYVDAMAARLLVGPVTAAQRTTICTFLEHAPTDRLKSTDAALHWRLPSVVALLLDTPNFIVR